MALSLALPGVRTLGSKRPFTFCVIGDSISDSYTRKNLLWNHYLTALSGGSYVQWSNNLATAVSGISLNNAFESSQTAILPNACNPLTGEIVFLQVGTNDIPGGVSQWTAANLAIYQQRLRTAVGFLQASGKIPIMMAVTPKSSALADTIEATNVVRKAVAHDCGIPYIDTYALWGGDHASHTVDGTHPNALGAYKMARGALSVLDSLFGRPFALPFGGGVNAYTNAGATRGVIGAWNYTTNNFTTSGSATSVKTVGTDPGVVGNYGQVAWSSEGSAQGDIEFPSIKNVGNGGTLWTTGDILLLTLKLRCHTFTGNNAGVTVLGYQWGGPVGAVAAFNIISPEQWHVSGNDTGWLDLAYMVKPHASCGEFQCRIRVDTTSAFTGTVQFAEVALWDLTQLGIASKYTS